VGERLQALPVLELVPHHEFYDYEAKYTKGLTDLIVPARISAEATAEAQRIALAAHLALDCSGVSRVDMHLDPDGHLWITEVNSSPGMTETSDLPAAAKAIGMSYDDLVVEILRSAVAR
jgi:D-alanine-D-alanine ligase